MSRPRPHIRDLDVAVPSVREYFEQNDVMRRLVTPRREDAPLWTSEDHDETVSIQVPEDKFIEAFATAYCKGHMHWSMEALLLELTGFGHVFGGDPELHVSSAFHEFMEFHPSRYDRAVRDWVKETRTERPFATWTWARFEIARRWLEWDDVLPGCETEFGLVTLIGLAQADPALDELALVKFMPLHLMHEAGKNWPPTSTQDIPRHRVLPVENIVEILPRSEKDFADMDAYLSVKKWAFEDDKRWRAEEKARKKFEKLKHAANLEQSAEFLQNVIGDLCPETLAVVSRGAERAALEALRTRYLAKLPDFVDARGHFF